MNGDLKELNREKSLKYYENEQYRNERNSEHKKNITKFK